MSKSFIPRGYEPHLTLYQTQAAISLIKRIFQESLATELNLKRVSAPLFVDPQSGLNDNLNGVERPVAFGSAWRCIAMISILEKAFIRT